MGGDLTGAVRSGMPKDLGGGLVLRRATSADVEAVAAFNARVHHSPGGAFGAREPHRGLAAMTRDLMSGEHPACGAGDFTVVEDTRTGSVVSSAGLIRQRFSYEGLELDAGLPELVGTHPDYRRRGLVREQFKVLHAMSEARGHLMLGERHPLYEAIPEPPLYDLDRTDQYSFYVRVPDLPAFLRSVAPVLEARLASSVAAGHTAGLKLSFYGSGLRFDLQRGRLTSVDNWSPTVEDAGDASFPDLTFLQILFGHRSLQELDRAFADCRPGNADTRVLLQALFPKRPSSLWPVC